MIIPGSASSPRQCCGATARPVCQAFVDAMGVYGVPEEVLTDIKDGCVGGVPDVVRPACEESVNRHPPVFVADRSEHANSVSSPQPSGPADVLDAVPRSPTGCIPAAHAHRRHLR